MSEEFKCRKCGCHDFKKRRYIIRGKGMQNLRRKLSHQMPASFNRHDSKVVCQHCGHSQRYKE